MAHHPPRFLFSIGLALYLLNAHLSADQISVINSTSDPITVGETFDVQGVLSNYSSYPYFENWQFSSSGGTYEGLIAPDEGEFVFSSPGDYTIYYSVSYSNYGIEYYQYQLVGYYTVFVGYDSHHFPIFDYYPDYEYLPVYGYMSEYLSGSETITVVDAPVSSVPDGGSTLGLFGLSLSGLAGIRRKLGVT